MDHMSEVVFSTPCWKRKRRWRWSWSQTKSLSYKFIDLPKFPCVMEGISTLSDIFKDTTIRTKRQPLGWGEHWFATDDLINVIQTSSSDVSRGNMDSFLRPVRFFASYKNGNRCAPGATLHMFSPRWMEGKPIFANIPRLQFPLRRCTGFVSLDENFIAPLLIAAGNIFFESKAEQTAFARFVGLRLKPWKEEEKAAFKEKQITKSGFVLPGLPELREGSGFEKDPTDMVRRILRMRNSVLRDKDHAVYILNTCKIASSTSN